MQELFLDLALMVSDSVAVMCLWKTCLRHEKKGRVCLWFWQYFMLFIKVSLCVRTADGIFQPCIKWSIHVLIYFVKWNACESLFIYFLFYLFVFCVLFGWGRRCRTIFILAKRETTMGSMGGCSSLAYKKLLRFTFHWKYAHFSFWTGLWNERILCW